VFKKRGLKHRGTEGTEKEERDGGGDRKWEMWRGKNIERGLPKLDWIRSVVGRLYLGNAVVSIASAF
jgi:hypothetical protein